MIREGVSHRRGQRHVVYVVCYLKLGICVSGNWFRHCFSIGGRGVGCSELLFCGKGKGEIKKVFVDAKVYIVGWFGLRFPANLRAKRSGDDTWRGLGKGPRSSRKRRDRRSGQSESIQVR